MKLFIANKVEDIKHAVVTVTFTTVTFTPKQTPILVNISLNYFVHNILK